jgi:KDO2-lipid IV(A) lauroyltransferase
VSLSIFKKFRAPRYWLTWLLLGFMFICARLPYSWLLFIGKSIGGVFFLLSVERRHIARVNIDLCFPELNEIERLRIRKNCFYNMGISVMETALAWWGPAEKIRALYRVEGLKHIEKAVSEDKAVLLLSGHMSCTEIGARQLAFHLPFQAMYKPAKNKLFEAVMAAKRGRFYYEMVPRKQSLRLLRNLKRKIVTWYSPDQHFGHDDTVFAPFFGVPAVSLTATARIVKSTDAIVIPFFPYRLPGAQGYRLVIGAPLRNFPCGDSVMDATNVNRVIETAIRLAPDQYLWVHQRFRNRPPGEPPVY